MKRPQPVLRLFSRLQRSERAWAHDHHDDLSRRAEREMQIWKQTLSPRVRASIGEPSRRERVAEEISKERSRRTVRMTVATGTGCGTTELDHTASADRKAEARSTAGISPVASSRRLDGRERSTSSPQSINSAVTSGNMTASAPDGRGRSATSRPTATVGSD
jgi:hypothetical protein